MTWNGEIEPASVDQLREGRNGKTHLITADAGGISQQLREIDPSFRLRYSELGDYYVVYQQDEGMPEDGRHGHVVGTYKECDGRIVKSIQETVWKHKQPGYSLGEELNKKEDERIAKEDEKFSEEIGEMGERLWHAVKEGR